MGSGWGVGVFLSHLSISHLGRSLLPTLPLMEGFVGSGENNSLLLWGELESPAPLTIANRFRFCWSLTSVVMPLEPRSPLPAFLCWCYFSPSRVFLDKIWQWLTFHPMLCLTPSWPSWELPKTFTHPEASVDLEYNMISKHVSFNLSALNYSSLTFWIFQIKVRHWSPAFFQT